MSTINPAIAAAIAKAKAAEDQSKVVQGGGDYTPPPAGPTGMRLVGYFETGKENGEYQGKPKVSDKVELVFELIGKKHPPREVTIDGTTTLIPTRVSLNVNKSFSERGAWRKLFAKLNYDGSITHVAERLGAAFLGTIVHNTVTKDGKDTVYANLKNSEGEFMIGAPRVQVADPETGDIEERPLNVGPALTEPKMFLWDYCDKAMWDSIYIDGEYPARTDDKGVETSPARSKNVIQAKIKKASNYIGSPIYNILANNGEELDVGDAETAADVGVTTSAASGVVVAGADDPLASL